MKTSFSRLFIPKRKLPTSGINCARYMYLNIHVPQALPLFFPLSRDASLNELEASPPASLELPDLLITVNITKNLMVAS